MSDDRQRRPLLVEDLKGVLQFDEPVMVDALDDFGQIAINRMDFEKHVQAISRLRNTEYLECYVFG